MIIFPSGALPRTVKGTVQRPTAELLFAQDLAAVRRNEPLVSTGARALFACPYAIEDEKISVAIGHEESVDAPDGLPPDLWKVGYDAV